MTSLNTIVEQYFLEGCGRCKLHATPLCKVKNWQDELTLFRAILNKTELKEERKWGVPVYTLDGKNVIILSAFKEYAFISFLKGQYIIDSQNILQLKSENTVAERYYIAKNPKQIIDNEALILNFIQQAIEIEKKGLKTTPKKVEDFPIPNELQQAFEEDKVFKNAFQALTSGRKKGYLLHFNGAKSSEAKLRRIKKNYEKILKGKGFQET